jgi:long-chain acyl-CoA synthetase
MGLVYEPYGANGLWYEMQLKIAQLILQMERGLGGNLDLMVSGSAALQISAILPLLKFR